MSIRYAKERLKAYLNFRYRTHAEENNKLNSILTSLVDTQSIDFTNPEFEALQSSVLEMMKKLKNQISEQGVFRIIKIKQIGSMKEKSSLWKWYRPSKVTLLINKWMKVLAICENTISFDGSVGALSIDISESSSEPRLYIEFDFLAILKNTIPFDGSCWACQRAKLSDWIPKDKTKPSDVTKITQQNIICRQLIENEFKEELRRCFDNCKCPRLDNKSKANTNDSQKLHQLDCKKPVCDFWRVDSQTGRLRPLTLNTLKDWGDRCSLILLWESKTKMLRAPTEPFCSHSETNGQSTVTVWVDFLPAIENTNVNCKTNENSKNKYFLIPKKCNIEKHTGFRRSQCIYEAEHIEKLIIRNDNRFMCYRVAKYITDNSRWLPGYHIKTIALQQAPSPELSKCILEMFSSLKEAYKGGQLNMFDSDLNLLANDTEKERNKVNLGQCDEIISILSSVSKEDTLDTFLQKIGGSKRLQMGSVITQSGGEIRILTSKR